MLNGELTAFDGGQQRTFTLNELYDTEPLFPEWIDVLAGKLRNRWPTTTKPVPKRMMFAALTTGGGDGKYKVYQTIQDFFEFKESRAAKKQVDGQSTVPVNRPVGDPFLTLEAEISAMQESLRLED